MAISTDEVAFRREMKAWLAKNSKSKTFRKLSLEKMLDEMEAAFRRRAKAHHISVPRQESNKKLNLWYIKNEGWLESLFGNLSGKVALIHSEVHTGRVTNIGKGKGEGSSGRTGASKRKTKRNVNRSRKSLRAKKRRSAAKSH